MTFEQIREHFSKHKTIRGFSHFGATMEILGNSLPYSDYSACNLATPFYERLLEAREAGQKKDRFVLPYEDGMLFFCTHEEGAFLFYMDDDSEMRQVIDSVRKLVIAPKSIWKPISPIDPKRKLTATIPKPPSRHRRLRLITTTVPRFSKGLQNTEGKVRKFLFGGEKQPQVSQLTDQFPTA